jgi:hypothetical protein
LLELGLRQDLGHRALSRLAVVRRLTLS